MESIVSLSKNVIMPFQIGLALQLYHEFGSKQLVDILHVHGFCSSYDEVRRYLTSLANHEIDKIKNGAYIPNGIIPFTSAGCLIQEGSDNIDINTETVDGKDTFHSMARAVFQLQTEGSDETSVDQVKIKRGQNKSLPVDEQTMSLMSCLPFNKPKERPEPPRRQDAYNAILSCSATSENLSDSIWVLLRLLSREIVKFPIEQPDQSEQTIPFWTGFNGKISNSHPCRTLVTYASVVDSKPSDMPTVYTTMKKCVDMSKEVGQEHSIQTFDQQLYAVSQQVKWSMPDVFRSHILRLGGFHTLSCFTACIGKLSADGGLRDLLVDSGVYAGCTVDQMLSGKQFNRAIRGLTLAYEALSSLWLCAFFKWCDENGQIETIPQDVWFMLAKCKSSFTEESKADKVR
jgi:hypothetical protein